MQVTIHHNDLKEIMLSREFPENYKAIHEPVTELDTPISYSGGNGGYREIYFDGIHVGCGSMDLENPTVLLFESDFETVEMHFDLYGETSTEIYKSPGGQYDFSANRHNIIYVPEVKGTYRFNARKNQILEINLRPSVFRKYLPESEVFSDFLTKMKRRQPALLGKHHMPITPEMMGIIRAILDCRKTGQFKRMFIEAKVIELLMLQLEQFTNHRCTDLCSLKPRDIEKIHHAREIILKKATDPYSISDLARAVGTNTFTLKKGFKEVFGTTVFGMVNDIKMEQARELLLGGTRSVAEVSELVGYKHSSHFAVAFKRKYGMTPGKYKR